MTKSGTSRISSTSRVTLPVYGRVGRPVIQDTRNQYDCTNRIGEWEDMHKLTVKLLRAAEGHALDECLRLYQRSFNPDERVSPAVLRRVMVPSPERVNPVHLFAAYQGDRMVGGACALVLPTFSVVFGSYLFVAHNFAAGAWECKSFVKFFARNAVARKDGTGASTWKPPPLPARDGPPRWPSWVSDFFPLAGPCSPTKIRARSYPASSAISNSGRVHRRDFLNLLC